MNDLKITWIERQLAEALIKLRGTTDFATCRTLLTEMRVLIDQLDRLNLGDRKTSFQG